jgi:glycosyltransferase involved in cell wall biosynthesis
MTVDESRPGATPFETVASTPASFQKLQPRVSQDDRHGPNIATIELSIVMPCLNEQETLGACIRSALEALAANGISGEVVVADNGSTDGSVEIALASGARVVHVYEKGYGNALMGGVEEARGQYVVIGDADESYDFREVPRFLERLRAGDDFVLGNRFKGGIHSRAMPWHHRFIGNPMLTGILNLFFGTSVGDVHCGMRAFTAETYRRLHLRTTGMEFASEMIVKAFFERMRIGEVPISYWPDGRSRPSHLRSFRDGWRHLRFLLLYSPRWLFAVPGIAFLGLGLALNAVLFFGPVRVGRLAFDIHMMVFGTLLALLGFQILCVGAFAKTFALTELLLPPDIMFEAIFKRFTLERGLMIGALVACAGFVLLGGLVATWYHAGFGPLELNKTLRPAIAGMTLVVLGVQTIFASFFMSILGLRRMIEHSA